MTLSSQDEVRRIYDGAADSYDRMMDSEVQHPIYDRVLSQLAAKIESVKGAVLDSSCGTGHMLERMQRVHAPDRELIGVDISPRMVEIAKHRLGNSVTVLECDMRQLSRIPDSHCAAVISFLALHHVETTEFQDCLTEWNRVLAPGGHLLIATWEGDGEFTCGGEYDAITRKYSQAELVEAVAAASFHVAEQSIQSIGDMGNDAVLVLALKID